MIGTIGYDYRYSFLLPKVISKREVPGMAKVFKKASIGLAVLGILILLVTYAPSVWYGANPRGTDFVTRLISGTAQAQGQSSTIDGTQNTPKYEPKLDSTLPLENSLVINSIGVDTAIGEASYENIESALKKGVWRAPDFDTPVGQNAPVILAAHRFGYLTWSNVFRKANSFYNLPKTAVGDTVEINWHQRKYVYEIYEVAQGEQIDDYEADLILYTCKTLKSKERVFRYARLIEA